MSRAMKDSGIPWIGEIPSRWDTCFIKQVMRNKSVKGYPDEQVLSLYRDYGVVPKDSRDDNHNVTSEDTSGYKLVDVGDFVINKMKAWQGSMAVSGYRGIISPAYYICRFTAPVYKKYIHYLLRNETYKAEYLRLSTGLRVGQWDLNVDDFLHIPMVLPPISEQQTIADFLDKKCGEIDEMVSLQEKIVEELKAYKQSVITEAVCKGLNPDVPMKDSGIEWIGQIPNHWGESKLKNVASLKTGTTPNGFDMPQEDNVVPWYTPTDITEEGNEISKYERTLNLSTIMSEGISLFPKHSLLFVGIGASAGKIGYVLKEGYSNQQITALIPFNCVSKYYFYYLTADRKRLRDNAFFTTLPIINNAYLSQEKITVPPLLEQKAIADYLDTKCAEIDALISLKQSKIEALKEYKKSIIYEYITGKKEVI